MRKQLITLGFAVMLSVSMAISALAGWEEGTGEHVGKYRYFLQWTSEQPGEYLKGWHWLSSRSSLGLGRCYYFDENGWLYTNTTTPDGYTVNEDGFWMIDGEVQLSGGYNSPYNPEKPNEIFTPYKRVSGTEVKDGKSVEQITLNLELCGMIGEENSLDNFPDRNIIFESDQESYSIIEFNTRYRGKDLKVRGSKRGNRVWVYFGRADMFLNNLPEQGIRKEAFYENSGFEEGPIFASTGTMDREFGLAGGTYRVTEPEITLPNGEDIRLFILLTQGSDGHWYIYPDSVVKVS